MRFPYYHVNVEEFEPIVTLKVLGKEGWVELEAYIDSGASFSIFHKDRADVLGINYETGQEIFVTVGDGGLLKVYLHKLKVELANEKFTASMGFSNQLGVGFNLLGRKSFFDRFLICFNDKKRFVELNKI